MHGYNLAVVKYDKINMYHGQYCSLAMTLYQGQIYERLAKGIKQWFSETGGSHQNHERSFH